MPMLALLVLVLVALCGLPASWITAAAPANPGDAAAMLALANWTGAASSLGWGVKSADPCDGTWAGVSCNDAGRVTSIVASRAGLDGVLSGSDLSSLSFLAELDLSFNSLTTPTGGLPLLPTPLQHLRALDLRSNHFIDIPEGFFAGFPALEMITIDDNPMAAPELRLDVLTGSAGLRSFSANHIGLLIFPDYFGNALVFPTLETLSLTRNEMSGRIPPSFGNNSRIKYLDISGQIDSSEGIRLLVGRIDQFIPGMKSLVEVRMDRNGFVGPLPDTTKLANLRVFSAADNNLCGVPKFAGSVSVDLKGNPHVGTPC
ncbi:hypothetical protein C2845_PM02G01950 [Panicum miliaceum]|uniref:Leucine-rich repeat-containing N-terminal plant-type domain-containing protein n=1 Tax=Panicum miliaceum TaxID=4540 RepID=A0A3L6S828_PANMI|nr:hypothetical protein C2845_PM02G01950 [Panicum miliaceum]